MQNNMELIPEFQTLVDKAKERNAGKPMRIAIAGADAENILQGAVMAQQEGFAEPILIGNYKKINQTLERLGLSDRKFDIQPVSNDTNVVQYAIEMIQAGSADALMRGNTQTRDFLMPVLNKVNHLIRPDRLLTHIVMIKIPTYHKMLAISDVTLLVNPSIEERKKVIVNMVDALHVFGVKQPNIGLLSLIEKPAFHMKDTVEAQTILIDHQDEPIADCNLVEPDRQGSGYQLRCLQLRYPHRRQYSHRHHRPQRIRQGGLPVRGGLRSHERLPQTQDLLR